MPPRRDLVFQGLLPRAASWEDICRVPTRCRTQASSVSLGEFLQGHVGSEPGTQDTSWFISVGQGPAAAVCPPRALRPPPLLLEGRGHSHSPWVPMRGGPQPGEVALSPRRWPQPVEVAPSLGRWPPAWGGALFAACLWARKRSHPVHTGSFHGHLHAGDPVSRGLHQRTWELGRDACTQAYPHLLKQTLAGPSPGFQPGPRVILLHTHG